MNKVACLTEEVRVYRFNHKSDVWWARERNRLTTLGSEVFQIPWQEIDELSSMVARTMDWTITIFKSNALVTTAESACSVSWRGLDLCRSIRAEHWRWMGLSIS